jgi:16S rRNA (cytosine967-C5)-methyltransferase
VAVASARSIAARVLVRVERDGAFAAASLDAELSRHPQLDPRDRALATELAYGSLRVRVGLLEQVSSFAARGIDGLDPLTRAHLVLAAYQILFLARVPSFAAVDEAVNAIKLERGAKLAGFVNAVLRRFVRERGGARREEWARKVVERSTPVWLRKGLVETLGAEGAADFLAPRIPPLGLCVFDPAARDTWLETLRGAHPDAHFEAGRFSPHAILVDGAGDPKVLPGSGTAWMSQEEGSQVVALALGAKAGHRVLDACAGRGNKTAILRRGAGESGRVDAADLHPAKLERLATVDPARAPQRTFAVDWTQGPGDCTGPYDRILVDAPCSGIGTVGRRPDILLRRTEADVQALAATQVGILRAVAPLLSPEGRLVYAVCSVLRKEAEDVLAQVADVLVAAPFDAPGIDIHGLAGDAPAFRLLPSVHGTDGYFVASLKRAP